MKTKAFNKVGLIDSGIAADYQDERITRVELFNDDGYDSTGHGTLCASMILKINPNAEIHSVKAFDVNTSCSSDRLLEILKRFRDIDVNIINMSLSTQDMMRADEYSRVCDELANQGKVLVASLSNSGAESLPAILPSVIGVGGCDTFFDNDYVYYPGNKIECFFDSKPVMLRNIIGEYELFGGNSKACAALSGLISSAEIPKSKNLHMTVRKMLADRSLNKAESVQNNKIVSNEDDTVRIEKIIVRVLGKRIDFKAALFEQFSAPSDATAIIEELENEYEVKANYNVINLYDFTSIATLSSLVRNKTTMR